MAQQHVEHDAAPTYVRLVVEYRKRTTERLWGELVRPGIARVLGISHWSNLSHGDLVKVDPLCSCGEKHPHYEPRARIFRASRRVQFFTAGTHYRRNRAIAQYLVDTWPTAPGYTTGEISGGVGYVGTQIMPDGFPAGIVAYPTPDAKHNDTHWRIAFPWPTRRRDAVAFLDACPHVTWHELRKGEFDR